MEDGCDEGQGGGGSVTSAVRKRRRNASFLSSPRSSILAAHLAFERYVDEGMCLGVHQLSSRGGV